MYASQPKRSFFHIGGATLALLLLTVTACTNDTSSGGRGGVGAGKTEQRILIEQTVIENIADNVILATYRDLRDHSAELATLAQKLRQNPNQANLVAVQNKWRETRVPWESSEGFLFGPVVDIDPTIDFWPLSIADLGKILIAHPTIDIATVRSLGDDVRGFHTSEFLIFGDGEKKNTKTIEEMSPAQLHYLVAVTTVIQEQTERLYSQWAVRYDVENEKSPPYVQIVKTPGMNDNRAYPSRSSVLQQYAKGMEKIAIEVGSTKLATPLGGDIGSAKPSKVESQFSWNSLSDFQNNIHSIRNIYTGDYRDHKGAGLDEIVKLSNPPLDAQLLKEIQNAEEAIAAIAGPEGLSYTHAIANESARERTKNAIVVVQTLEATIREKLIPLLR